MWRLSHGTTQLISLLRAASRGRTDFPLAALRDAQIRWAIDTGLGPLVFQTTEADPQAAHSSFWPLLQSAKLTAQIIAGEQLDAMDEIIDASQGSVSSLTLLKGISICDQHYPAPHLRPMRDIDCLVEAEAVPTVESLLSKLGYRQQSNCPPEFFENHHHSMPFFHLERGVWVEVHRQLVPHKIKVGDHNVFSLKNVHAELQPSEFRGRKVTRLSNELQIVYIASHWARDFKIIGGMVEMIDMIYLLRNAGDSINWEKILLWLDGSASATYLYLMLTFLNKHHLIDIAPQVLDALFRRQRSFGQLNLRILHALMARHLVDGRTFGRVLDSGRTHFVWTTLLSPTAPSQNLLVLAQQFLQGRLRRLKLVRPQTR
jgi:hypothetical protein